MPAPCLVFGQMLRPPPDLLSGVALHANRGLLMHSRHKPVHHLPYTQLALQAACCHIYLFFRPASIASWFALQMGFHKLTAHACLQKRALQSLRSLGLADDIMTAALAEHTSTASRSAFLLVCNLSAWRPISAAGHVAPDYFLVQLVMNINPCCPVVEAHDVGPLICP